MAAIDGSARTERNAAAHRGRADRPAKRRLRKRATEMTDGAAEIRGIAKDAVQETLGQLRDNASEIYDRGRDKAHRAGRAVEQVIQKRPLASVLVAAGAGAIAAGAGAIAATVGFLLCRSWMRR